MEIMHEKSDWEGLPPSDYWVTIKGPDNYVAKLSWHISDEAHESIKAAAEKAEAEGKTGEDLVQAIFKAIPTTTWRSIHRYKTAGDLLEDRYLNNGPNGEPAVETYDFDGLLHHRAYYENGALNDGPQGQAAEQQFDGKILVQEAHYEDGKLNDGPDGEPGLQRYSRHKGGRLWDAWHCKDGEMVKQLGFIARKLAARKFKLDSPI